MAQQNILSQLGQYGLGVDNWMDIANISPEQISAAFTDFYDLGEGDLLPGLFQNISKRTLGAGIGKTYSPGIEAYGTTLLDNLTSSMSGKKATEAFGGFAGGKGAADYTKRVRDVYGKEAAKGIVDFEGQRLAGVESVSDMINQWLQTATDVKYGNV